MKKTIVVFFGGISPEHEVSVITGLQILANLDKEKYLPIPIYVAKDGIWYTGDNLFNSETYKNLSNIPIYCNQVYFSPEGTSWSLKICHRGFFKPESSVKINVIFPCFHGGLGENGGFQGLFEITGIPYVGSSILGSALGMDKVSAKAVFAESDIVQSDYIAFDRRSWDKEKSKILKNIRTKLKFPLFVKPASSGSSIGVSKVVGDTGLENAVEVAFCFGTQVLVEKAIQNAREVNVSVMGNIGGDFEVSVCEEVFAKDNFLSFDDKYKSNNKGAKGMAATNRMIPAEISKDLEIKIKEIAMKAFRLLSCSGIVRVDFLIKGSSIYLLEVNTIPGSFSFYLWEASKVRFSALCDKLIQLAEETHKQKSNLSTSFSGNLLSNIGASLINSK